MLDNCHKYGKLLLLGDTQQEGTEMATPKQDPIEANDDFITLDEMVSMPRGRKSEIDGTLVNLLSQVTNERIAKLSRHFGQVPKAKRQTVSGSIRKHWALSGQVAECSITYTPDGVAQVKPRG